jgi:hypothetical protein
LARLHRLRIFNFTYSPTHPGQRIETRSYDHRHKADLYLSGHDHDLQHLEFKGHPTSFVISGGGAELVGWTTSPIERGPWGLRAAGFTDLQISQEALVVRHIGKRNRAL